MSVRLVLVLVLVLSLVQIGISPASGSGQDLSQQPSSFGSRILKPVA